MQLSQSKDHLTKGRQVSQSIYKQKEDRYINIDINEKKTTSFTFFNARVCVCGGVGSKMSTCCHHL